VHQQFADSDDRKRVFDSIIGSGIVEWIAGYDDAAALDRVRQMIREMIEKALMTIEGVVYIVGAGPGDPELITVKGLKFLRESDVVLHDRLISTGLLTQARGDAVVIDVGKRFGHEDRSSPKFTADD
jgi:hypothetical protein